MNVPAAALNKPLLSKLKDMVIPDAVFRLTLWVLLMSTALAVSVASVMMSDKDVWLQVLKFVLALILAMIPGWIYLLFIRNKGPSLYDEFVLNLFRLKIDSTENLPAPPQHTNYYKTWHKAHRKITHYIATLPVDSEDQDPPTPTKDNLYRRKFEAIYGRASVSTRGMLDPKQRIMSHTETFSPVLIATILVCLGWVLVLPPHMAPVENMESEFRGVDFEALKFAFFGAYGFTLLDLVRRYFRDDLRAGAYLGLVVRIVFVGLLATATSVLLRGAPIAFTPPWSDTEMKLSVSVVAFLIGFFPQAGMQLIIDTVQRATGWLFPALKTTHPLSEIDGLNIWYETRLTEEGIDDMQNLASANFVDLMLKTRAPVSRLVDWMDQAYLALHLWPVNGHSSNRRRTNRSSAVHGLRGLGIRTATDLEEVWAARRDDPVFGKLVSKALGVAEDEGPAIVEAVLASFEGESNLHHIRQFRTSCWLETTAGQSVSTAPQPVPAV